MTGPTAAQSRMAMRWATRGAGTRGLRWRLPTITAPTVAIVSIHVASIRAARKAASVGFVEDGARLRPTPDARSASRTLALSGRIAMRSGVLRNFRHLAGAMTSTSPPDAVRASYQPPPLPHPTACSDAAAPAIVWSAPSWNRGPMLEGGSFLAGIPLSGAPAGAGLWGHRGACDRP